MKNGFTLVELVFVLLITSLLVTLGFPAFSDMLQRNLVLSEVHLLENEFNKARRRAVVDSYPMMICSLDAGNHCQSSWQNKIDIFRDENGNRTLDASELYVRTHTIDPRLDLVGKLSAGRAYLRYDPDGTTHGTAGSMQLCNPDFAANNQRAIIISFTGRLRRSADRNNDGIHEAGRNNICL